MQNRHAIPVLAVLVATLAAATILLAPGGSETTTGSPLSSRQLRAFAVLRGEPEPPPAAVVAQMEEIVESRDFRLVYSQAHQVQTPIGIAWVVPGRGFLCVMGSVPLVAGCNTTRQTIRQGMSVVAILPAVVGGGKRYELFGLAPDGVESVEVKVGDRRGSAPVSENVYVHSAPRMIRARIPDRR